MKEDSAAPPKDLSRLQIDQHSSYFQLDLDETIRRVVIDGGKKERLYMYYRFPIKITVELG
jgi:hypothetical protein